MLTIILTAVGCLLLGVILTLWVEWRVCSVPIQQKDDEADLCNRPVPLELPKELLAELEELANRTAVDGIDSTCNNEALLAVNLLVQFFFRELRSQGSVRRFLLERINLEMEEALTKGSINRIIKGLKIYDVEMGSRAPSIHRIEVNSVGLDDDKQHMESVDLNLDIEYSGGLGIAIDVALAYGKSAFLSVKVAHLKGTVRLRFSRRPYSHWSVTFCHPPQLEVDVTSRVQGRSFSHVTSLVSSQIHKWIQRKYTLPACRIRHRPFFLLPEQALLPPSAKLMPATRKGSLEVTILEISRLNPLLQGDGFYCTLALDSCSWMNLLPSDSERRVIMEMRIVHRNQPTGILFHSSSSESTPQEETKDLKELQSGVAVMDIELGSAAEEAGLRVGDVLLQVDDTPIHSVQDAVKAINKTKEQFVILRVERFVPKRSGSMVGSETISPSVTLDNLDQKSPLAAALEEQFSTSLILPLVGSNAESIRTTNGGEVKRTPTYTLDKNKPSGVIPVGDVVKFRVTPNLRFLNMSVVLTGTPVSDETDNGSSKAGSQASPSKTAVAKSNLTNLFKKHSPRRQQHLETNKDAKDSGKELKGTRTIGHVNISLPEVLADCQLNTQGHHISTYQIFPTDLAASLGRQHVFNKQLGFEPRLCYGDVVLSFVYRPDRKDESPSSSPELDSDAADLSIPLLSSPPPPPPPVSPPTSTLVDQDVRPTVDIAINDTRRSEHDYVITHLQLNSVRVCELCHKKIWLREAFQCRSCGSVCHKKCIKRFPDRKWCGAVPDLFIVPTEVAKEAVEDNPFSVAEEDGFDEIIELEAAVERLQSREHSESLIRLAKESGKGLYSHLSSVDRRAKISSMLQRLEAATEVETIRHYELANKLEKADGAPWSTSERSRMEKEAAECESRRQALVLLLLFYSAGLRSAEDADQQQQPADCCD